MLRILFRILLALVLLLSLGLFAIGGLFWFGLRHAGYDPPIPLGVANVLASYPCQVPREHHYWDQTRVRLKNIEVDLSRVVTSPSNDIWHYVPVQGTGDKLYVEYWRSDAPPAGPITVIGYQLREPPASSLLPPSLDAQSQRGELYVVSYDNRNYYEYQHQEATEYFILGFLLLVLAALGVGVFYATRPLRRWMKSRGAAAARLAGEPTSPAEIAAAQARHARLLETLHDCGVDRAPTSGGLRWVGSVIVVFALAIAGAIGNAVVNQAATGPDGTFIRIIWVAFVIFVLARIRNWFLRSAWKSRARSAESELQRSSSRRPILYLRSFQLDQQIGRPSWIERLLGTIPLQTAEQKVTKVLRTYGPVIAIGRPDERLPPLGAARFYVGHDRWKVKVAEIARESRFVVWATGVTEGLIWEIAHLIENVRPEDIILWAHPHLLRLDAAGREAEWAKFRAVLGHLFPKPLPEKLGEARFFYFTPDWEPRPIAPPRRFWTWFGSDVPALRALLGVKQGTLNEADVVYPGPQPDDDFAGLIGASGIKIRWSRCAVFFIANVVSLAPYLFLNPSWFLTHGLLSWALLSVAAVAAFRYLPRLCAPAAAATIPALFEGARGGLRLGLFANSFVNHLTFLAGLAWATRRIRPLVVALWIGTTCGLLASELFRYLVFGGLGWHDNDGIWWLVVRPIVFACCFALGIRLTPAPGEKNSQSVDRSAP